MAFTYIDTDNGSDITGDGTELNPFKSAQHFVINVRVGRTFEVLIVEGAAEDNWNCRAIIEAGILDAANLTFIQKTGGARYNIRIDMLNGGSSHYWKPHQHAYYDVDLILDANGTNFDTVNSNDDTIFDGCNLSIEVANWTSSSYLIDNSSEAWTFNNCTFDFGGITVGSFIESSSSAIIRLSITNCIFKNYNGTNNLINGCKTLDLYGNVFYNCTGVNKSLIELRYGNASGIQVHSNVANNTFIIKKANGNIFDGLFADDVVMNFRSNVVVTDGVVFGQLFKDINSAFGEMSTGDNMFDGRITIPAQYSNNSTYPDFADEAEPFISIDPNDADFAKLKITSAGFKTNAFEIGRDIGGINNASAPAVYTDPGIANVRKDTAYTFNDAALVGTLDVDVDANHAAEEDVRLNILYGSTNQFTGELSTSFPTSTNPGVGNVRNGVAYIINDDPFSGTLVIDDEANHALEADVKIGSPSYGENLDKNGTLDSDVEANSPAITEVRTGETYGVGNAKTGTADIPSPDDVRTGVAVDATTGNLTLPTVDQTELGITFGTNGIEFTGTVRVLSVFDVRNQTLFGPNDSLVGEAVTYTIDPGRVPLKLFTSDGSILSGTQPTPTFTEYFINNSTTAQIDAQLAVLGIPERIANSDITVVIDPENGNLLALRMDR